MARRRGTKRRRGEGRFGFFRKLASTLLICAVIVLALTLFFRVDTIEVTGEQRYTKEQVVEAAGVKPGSNLFLLNKYAVAGNLVKELPYIEEIRINRALPDTLLIDVRECGEPVALVQDGFVWLISAGGKIVDQRPPEDAAAYLQVDGCALLDPAVGAPMALVNSYAAQQESLLSLLAALTEAGVLDQVQAIHLDDVTQLTMDYAQRFTVELSYGADYGYKLRALQAVVDELEVNETGTIQLVRDDGRVNFIRG